MAGRIPQNFIDDLLDRADIVDVIDSRVTLKKSGRNFMACCPFHDEKTPSFSVQPEKQFYYCFGCGASGNALGFLMEYERLDFRVAIENLAGKYGMTVPQDNSEDSAHSQKKRGLYDAMEQADALYRELLRSHPAGKGAVNYLKERGLSAGIVQAFGVGFVPPGWDNLMKKFSGDTRTLERMLEAGMLVHRDAGGGKQRVYDRFRHRIMFPIRDSRGRTIAFGGRVMGDDKPKYLNSPETPIYQKSKELYGLYEARQANKHLPQLLIVEGYMDVIALAQHGISNAVATLGTATSQTHLQRLFRHCEELVFCFDGDQAGAAAARRALDVALPVIEDGQQIRFLFLPQGEDPDSMVRSEGADEFQQRLATAQPLSEYLFSTAGQGLALDTADGKAAMSRRALALIGKLPVGAFQGILQAELASRTGLDKAAISRLAHATGEIADDTPPPPDPYRAPSDAGFASAPGDMPEPPPGYDEPPQALSDEMYFDVDADQLPPRRPQRRPRSSGAPEPLSLPEVAISLLVYNPKLAGRAGDISQLAELTDPDMPLLLELFELLERLSKRPGTNTAIVLGYWYGQPEQERLTELCGRGIELLREGLQSLAGQGAEPDADHGATLHEAETAFTAGVEQRFIDTMDRLRAQLGKTRVDKLLQQIDDLQRQGQTPPQALRDELRLLLQQHPGGGHFADGG